MEALYDKQKEQAGRTATFLWLLIGTFLFFFSDKAVFLSWEAAVYFLGGMFLSALVFGTGLYVAQRLLAKTLIKIAPSSSPALKSVVVLAGLGLQIFCAVAIYYTGNWFIENLMF